MCLSFGNIEESMKYMLGLCLLHQSEGVYLVLILDKAVC